MEDIGVSQYYIWLRNIEITTQNSIVPMLGVHLVYFVSGNYLYLLV